DQLPGEGGDQVLVQLPGEQVGRLGQEGQRAAPQPGAVVALPAGGPVVGGGGGAGAGFGERLVGVVARGGRGGAPRARAGRETPGAPGARLRRRGPLRLPRRHGRGRGRGRAGREHPRQAQVVRRSNLGRV